MLVASPYNGPTCFARTSTNPESSKVMFEGKFYAEFQQRRMVRQDAQVKEREGYWGVARRAALSICFLAGRDARSFSSFRSAGAARRRIVKVRAQVFVFFREPAGYNAYPKRVDRCLACGESHKPSYAYQCFAHPHGYGSGHKKLKQIWAGSNAAANCDGNTASGMARC